MSKSPKKENRLKGLTIDELYGIDPWEMQLNGVEIEYAKKRTKEDGEGLEYQILYFKTEIEAMRKSREKYEPVIDKWSALADAQGNLLTEYVDLINEMLVAYKDLENRKLKILGDAISKLKKQWEEDYKRGKAKREKQNKELNNLRRQRRPINQKYYDLNRKPNKKEEKAAELHVFINHDEILKTDNQKEVFKSYVKHKGDFFAMSGHLGKKEATLKDTWKRIEEINKQAKSDYIAEIRKKPEMKQK